MKKRLGAAINILVVLALVVTIGINRSPKVSATVPGTNQLVSQDSSGDWSNGNSELGSPHAISGNGRYVVFVSSATDLVSNDPNSYTHVYLRDTQDNTTTLIDAASDGTIANGNSSQAAISYDGRFVVFTSNASNLISGISGGNVYVKDLSTGTMSIADTTSSDTVEQGSYPDISADGRYVVFETGDASGFGGSGSHLQIVIKDMDSGATQLLTNGSSDSMYPSIDCSGNVVTFLSSANLTGQSGDHIKEYNAGDLFYAKIGWSSTELVDATYTKSGVSWLVGTLSSPQISCNGNGILYFPGYDGDPINDLAEYNRLTNTFTTIDSSDNEPYAVGSASISDDGRYVTFLSKGTNLSSYPTTYRGSYEDIYVEDTTTGTIQLVSFTALGNLSGLIQGYQATISPDGSTVAYGYNTPSSSNTNGELISGMDTGVRDVYTSKTGY